MVTVMDIMYKDALHNQHAVNYAVFFLSFVCLCCCCWGYYMQFQKVSFVLTVVSVQLWSYLILNEVLYCQMGF